MMPLAEPFEEITGEAPKRSNVAVERELGTAGAGHEGEVILPFVSGKAFRLSSAAAT
jgi:hypothetical protein